MKSDTVIEFRRPPVVTQMSCTVCGAQAEASCNCGAPYLPAGQKAAQALSIHPEKSNRAIATEIGVDEGTVRRARKEGAEYSAPEFVIGKDGKSYPSSANDEQTISGADPELRAALLDISDVLQSERDCEARLAKLQNRAGNKLIQLRGLVEMRGEEWWEFCAARIHRTRREIERFLAAASK